MSNKSSSALRKRKGEKDGSVIDKEGPVKRKDSLKSASISKDESCDGESVKSGQKPERKRYNRDGLLTPSDMSSDEEDDVLPGKQPRAYIMCLCLFSLASLLSRLYNIELPEHVCWDETHFGKMGSWYINRTFFFDVHPPLGKMLIGLAGVMTGYDGSFPFAKPGDEYGDANYVGMRVFCATCGSMLVPISYKIVWQLTHSLVAAIFAACLVLFDTGTLTLSRHILLDPILLLFILMATYCSLRFKAYQNKPFTFSWWGWLSVTGIFLSCAIGVKFVGLFVVLLVGLTTASDLWEHLGNQDLPLVDVMKHLGARVACLIGLPIVCYMVIFSVHFNVLSHSGNGDGFYSSAFQSQLIGNKLHNVSMPENIAFGSLLTLKQRRTGGAYLHSHWHLYPEEHPPKQQQVTSYSHKDDNNQWRIKPAEQDVQMSDPPQLVKSGDLIRLEHVVTRRNLHSHKELAPLSKRHYQVTGYGQENAYKSPKEDVYSIDLKPLQNGTGDSNDVWMIEVVGSPLGTPVQTVRSKLRIIHYFVKCALHSHDKKLPKWGWEQLEATCNPNMKDPKSMWSVEEVYDSRLPNVSFEVYSPSFLEKFLESHAVMTQGNSGLKPKEGEITSQPWQWPIDYRGQIFSAKNHRIYLLGNPVIFWGLLAIKAIFLLFFVIHRIKLKRGIKMQPAIVLYNEKTFRSCWWLLLGWGLHYLPFWTMGRVLYFHHYFPAFLYSAMFGGVMLDYMVTRFCLQLPENWAVSLFPWLLGIVILTLAGSFYLFYPLSFGVSGPMAIEEGAMMHGLKWMDSWDI